jgi:hypothetical protein
MHHTDTCNFETLVVPLPQALGNGVLEALADRGSRAHLGAMDPRSFGNLALAEISFGNPFLIDVVINQQAR